MYAFVGLVHRDTDVNSSCVYGNECAYTQVKRLTCLALFNFTPLFSHLFVGGWITEVSTTGQIVTTLHCCNCRMGLMYQTSPMSKQHACHLEVSQEM